MTSACIEISHTTWIKGCVPYWMRFKRWLRRHLFWLAVVVGGFWLLLGEISSQEGMLALLEDCLVFHFYLQMVANNSRKCKANFFKGKTFSFRVCGRVYCFHSIYDCSGMLTAKTVGNIHLSPNDHWLPGGCRSDFRPVWLEPTLAYLASHTLKMANRSKLRSWWSHICKTSGEDCGGRIKCQINRCLDNKRLLQFWHLMGIPNIFYHLKCRPERRCSRLPSCESWRSRVSVWVGNIVWLQQ